MTTAEKIQLALHGNRDQRSDPARDRIAAASVSVEIRGNADDVLVAKTATVAPELLKQIGEREVCEAADRARARA
jgi:hypothetical protein